jgi:hypothetical protein
MGEPVVSNIIVGGATVYYAPVGESIPSETSVGLGEDWGGNWERFGYTKAPLAAMFEEERSDVDVEEHLTAVKRTPTKRGFAIETTLAELTPDYFNLAAGAGTVTEVAAGAGQRAYQEYAVGDDVILDEYVWGFEGMYVDDNGNQFPVRWFIWKGNSKVNGNISFSKRNGEYPGIPLRVDALADPSQSVGEELYKWYKVTAKATDE